jgi:hypothetical protein
MITHRRLLMPLRPKAAAGEWTPASVSGLYLWLDFSDAATMYTDAGSTLVSSDGDKIYQINDKTGTWNFSQSTEGLRPAYKTNIQNSLSAGYFLGDSRQRITASPTNASSITTFWILKQTASAGRYLMTFGITTKALISGYTAGKFEWYSTPRTDLGSVDTTKFQLIATTVGSSQSGGWDIGALSAAAGLIGYYGEILVYTGTLSAGDITTVSNYLTAKWNIT